MAALRIPAHVGPSLAPAAVEVAVAAIYLRGLDRPALAIARGWPEVVGRLRRGFGYAPIHELPPDWPSTMACLLQAEGFFVEAASIGSPALRQAESLIGRGLAIVVSSPFYPESWVRRLGASAPPAFYALGPAEFMGRSLIGVVGSRRPPTRCRRAAETVACVAGRAGYVVVSGGAPGIDRAAAGGAAALVELWPCGLGRPWGGARPAEALRLSLSPPREPFTTMAAMERNALIFALSEATFVAHARFKEGGAWHGAVSALRRRLGPVLVPAEEPAAWGQAWRALRGLGARPFDLAGLVGESGDGFRRRFAAALSSQLQPGLIETPPAVSASRALAAY